MNELDELIKLAGELYGKLKAYKEHLETTKKEPTREEIDYLKNVREFF